MSVNLKVDDEVEITFTGKVIDKAGRYVTIETEDGAWDHYLNDELDTYTVTVLKPAKVEYEIGCVYQDANRKAYYRTLDAWRDFAARDFKTDAPVLPMTLLVPVE